jgi:hypothetical protein
VNLRITESKPWYVYAQYANTGTSTTTKNRERFGFTHNQLTGRDDILSLDYTTGDFDEVHAVSTAYAAPFVLATPEWRYALGGGYSRFDAREAGIITASEVEGQDANAGGEISRQIFQHHELFVDARLGARWQHVAVENRQVSARALDADIDYAVPHADLRSRATPRRRACARGSACSGGFTDTSETDLATVHGGPNAAAPPALDVLGNALADDDFALTSFDASWSFYLEPLLDPYGLARSEPEEGRHARARGRAARARPVGDELPARARVPAGRGRLHHGARLQAVGGGRRRPRARLGRVPPPPAAPVLARSEPARAAGHGRVPAAPDASLGLRPTGT